MAGEKELDIGRIEAEEDFVLDAQYLIHDLLVDKDVSRAELARRLGLSKARISQCLKPGANPTLRTVAQIFFALGEAAHLSRKPRTVSASDLCVSEGDWFESRDVRISRDNNATNAHAVKKFLLQEVQTDRHHAEAANQNHSNARELSDFATVAAS